MANFFRSLDRALARVFTPPATGRPLLPTDPGAYEWPAVDLARHIEALGWQEYPVRFIAGVDPGDVDPEFLKPHVIWQSPEPVTIKTRNISLEMIELLTGLPLIPLAQREIPAWGTE